MKKLLLLTVLVLCSFSCTRNENEIPRVVILAFSGIRKADLQYLTSSLGDISKSGIDYNSLINLNSQMHIPSFQAALSGVNYPWMAFGDELLHPSIFQYVMNKYPQIERDRFWAIGAFTMSQMRYSKANEFSRMPLQLSAQPADMKKNLEVEVLPFLRDILSTNEIAFLRQYADEAKGWPYWDSFGEIYRNILWKILKEKKPYMVFAATGEAESGHYGSWARYVASIQAQAKFMRQVWDYVQKDEFYKGKTYFIILTDHFRDQYYMDHNEDSGVKKTKNWIFVAGPGVSKGISSNRKIKHTDLFATLAKIYSIPVHANQGEVLSELFEK